MLLPSQKKNVLKTERAFFLRTRVKIFFEKQIKLLFDTIETDWITWSSLQEIETLKVHAKEGRIYRLVYSGKNKIHNYITIL